MDESFYFKNDSFQLSDVAKKKLGKMLPIYARSLFGTKEIAQRIDGISITGYASSKYKKKYVNPFSTRGEAYEYNLTLSLNRAQQIVAFMFGNEIKNFRYKNRMRALTGVSGKGFMDPIKLDKENQCKKDKWSKYRKEECGCGPFHCKKSRRVEINFVLKDQKDAERHFDIIADKLQDKGPVNVGH